jgi:hypothetical protein
MSTIRHPGHPPDEVLLLWAHGAPPLWQRLHVGEHIRNCAACQWRADQFRFASQFAADALGDPADPRPWTPAVWPTPGSFLATLAGALATWPGRLLLLAALTVVLLTGFMAVRTIHHRAAATATQPSDDGPCRPGLPNDLCR